ncbi:hypothetical protein J6590_024007 [Homalodisca vitripennis]|nr:hypothetical protein J6590_024007 [Homalodisca vitripennis]
MRRCRSPDTNRRSGGDMYRNTTKSALRTRRETRSLCMMEQSSFVRSLQTNTTPDSRSRILYQ